MSVFDACSWEYACIKHKPDVAFMLWNSSNAMLSICDGESVKPRCSLPFLSDGRVNVACSPLNGSNWLPCSACLPAAQSQGQNDSRHRAVGRREERGARQHTWPCRKHNVLSAQSRSLRAGEITTALSHRLQYCAITTAGIFFPHYRTAKMLYINNSSASQVRIVHLLKRIGGQQQQTTYLVALKHWLKPFAKAFEFFRSLW